MTTATPEDRKSEGGAARLPWLIVEMSAGEYTALARATEDGDVAARFRVRADNADVNVRVFEIGRNVDLLDRDEFRVERAFPRDQFAEFAPDELVDPFETMFHRRES